MDLKLRKAWVNAAATEPGVEDLYLFMGTYMISPTNPTIGALNIRIDRESTSQAEQCHNITIEKLQQSEAMSGLNLQLSSILPSPENPSNSHPTWTEIPHQFASYCRF